MKQQSSKPSINTVTPYRLSFKANSFLESLLTNITLVCLPSQRICACLKSVWLLEEVIHYSLCLSFFLLEIFLLCVVMFQEILNFCMFSDFCPLTCIYRFSEDLYFPLFFNLIQMFNSPSGNSWRQPISFFYLAC